MFIKCYYRCELGNGRLVSSLSIEDIGLISKDWWPVLSGNKNESMSNRNGSKNSIIQYSWLVADRYKQVSHRDGINSITRENAMKHLKDGEKISLSGSWSDTEAARDRVMWHPHHVTTKQGFMYVLETLINTQILWMTPVSWSSSHKEMPTKYHDHWGEEIS